MRRDEESRSQEEKDKIRRPGQQTARSKGRLPEVRWRAAGQQRIDPDLVEIRPEPSPEERAAILMALEQMLGAPQDEEQLISAWALAGRYESGLGRTGGFRTGWTQRSDRLTGW